MEDIALGLGGPQDVPEIEQDRPVAHERTAARALVVHAVEAGELAEPSLADRALDPGARVEEARRTKERAAQGLLEASRQRRLQGGDREHEFVAEQREHPSMHRAGEFAYAQARPL